MKCTSRILPRSLALLVLAAGTSRMLGQDYYYDFLQPPPPRLTLPQLRYLNINVEAEQTSSRSKTGGGSTETQRLYLAPSIGIGWNYYLYHPDLLTYSFLLEPAYNWQQYGGSGGSRNDNTVILNGNASATLLTLKPYATTFTYDRSREEFHYDFFNAATVDTERWGVNSGYREGAVPVIVTAGHVQTDSSGLNYDSSSEQTTASVQAENDRKNGDLTDVNYQFSRYDSTSTDGTQTFGDTSTAHHFSLNDSEHFHRSVLSSSLFYDHIEDGVGPSDDVNLSLDYSIEHTAHLQSYYGYSFSDYSTEGAEMMSHSARAGLRHQLYDSLISAVGINGSRGSSDSFGSRLETYTVGMDGSLTYLKRLGDWGHLSLSDSASYNRTHQDSSGGQQLIPNESHTVDPTLIFFLDRPRDVTWVSLTDSTGTITYVQGSDYDVITTTDPWQIQIHTGGANSLNSGSVVKANYIVQPNPTGSYSTFDNGTQIRIDFWHSRAGIYARYNFSENYADSPAFVLDNVREFQAGADLNWMRFRLDANYTDRRSSFYRYQSVSLSEGYTFLASAKSTAGIDFHEQWSHYPGRGTNSAPQNVSYYSLTGRYAWRPVARLEWNSEAGYQTEHGAGLNQSFIVARSYLSWYVGKLDFRLGYEFENQEYTTEIRERHFLFLRMRRNF